MCKNYETQNHIKYPIMSTDNNIIYYNCKNFNA